jgi:hypothetical protein
VVTNDGTVQERFLEGQPVLHLQIADHQLYVGTWGKGCTFCRWSMSCLGLAAFRRGPPTVGGCKPAYSAGISPRSSRDCRRRN